MLSTIFFVGLVVTSVIGIYIPPGPRYPCPERQNLLHPCICVQGSDKGLYVKCENANLASLSIGLINLSHESAPIEELILHKCHIGKHRDHWHKKEMN